jgi:hypothetical protein
MVLSLWDLFFLLLTDPALKRWAQIGFAAPGLGISFHHVLGT